MIVVTFALMGGMIVPLLTAQQVRFANTSRYIGNQNWEWTIYADEPSATLDRITSITYLLHPTFSPANIAVKRSGLDDTGTRFGLRRTGWGTFRINIRVKWLTGAETRHAHDLEFRSDPVPVNERPRVVARIIRTTRKGRDAEYTVGVTRASLPRETLLVQYATSRDEDEYADILQPGNDHEIAYPARVVSTPGRNLPIRLFLKDGRNIPFGLQLPK
jgi:transcription initiation factor IIF auxiliary subunit